MSKFIIPFLFIYITTACNSAEKPNSIRLISDATQQEIVFNNLVNLTNKAIPEHQLKDSLAFLVLPVKLSCAACRKKTIDSIVKHQDDLQEGHFIIISASEGLKNIRSYFLEEDEEMPVMVNRLFLDSNNTAYKNDLVKENPVIYYTANKKAFKKVSAIPATVRDDLREFFSGTRESTQLSKK